MIQYVLFERCETITHLISNDPGAVHVQGFPGLTHLELNQIQKAHFTLIESLVQREIAPYLTELRCNLDYLVDATRTFYTADLDLLRALHQKLQVPPTEKTSEKPSPIYANRPEIYFCGLKVDLSAPFTNLHFLESYSLFYAHYVSASNLGGFQCWSITQCRYRLEVQDLNRQQFLIWSYPNIRAVSLYNPNFRLAIDEEEFLTFLQQLNSLVDLNLQKSAFTQSFFCRLSIAPCTNLSNQRPRNVADRLNTFVVLEFALKPIEDFSFLRRFEWLRCFHTDRATKEQMLQLVGAWSPYTMCEWQFDFHPSAAGHGVQEFGQDFTRWIVKFRDAGSHLSYYELTIRKFRSPALNTSRDVDYSRYGNREELLRFMRQKTESF